jgi:hypothetical protein
MPSEKDYSFTEVDNPSIIKEEVFLPSTFETMDTALFNHINDDMNIFCVTNKGWEKVPVIWVSAERAYQVKNSKEMRDVNMGAMILPVISVERTSVTKDLNRKGGVFGNVPPVNDSKGGTITIARMINQEKTSNFANASAIKWHDQKNYPRKNKKVVYQTATIPLPVYVEATYSVKIQTEYQQQINEILTPFITRPGGINYIVIRKDGHTYEAFVQQDFTMENNVSKLEEEERKYQTKIDIKVLGYLIGEGKNSEQPRIVYRENAVDVKIGRERVILGDVPEHIDKKGFYRD